MIEVLNRKEEESDVEQKQKQTVARRVCFDAKRISALTELWSRRSVQT